MSEVDEGAPVEPPVPASIWWFAWTFVVGQVLELARRGAQSEDAWIPSALLGAVLVSFISHGVVRARWVRFWLVVVLIGLAGVFEVVSLIDSPSGWTAAALALTIGQAFLLHRYTRSDLFEHHRQRRRGGPSLAPLVAVAALVGVLGGVLGAEQSTFGPGIDQTYDDDPFGDPFGGPSGQAL